MTNNGFTPTQRERPDYWASWTKPIPVWLLLMLLVILFPIYIVLSCAIGLGKGLLEGLEAWKDEVGDVWRFYRGK